MRKFSRKALVAGGLVATLGVGGIAFAFFTANGSGTGSASVGSPSPITISASAPDALYPAGPAADVTITVTNPGSGSQHVGSVSLDSVDASNALCDTSAFTMDAVTVNQTIAPGDNTVVHGSLSMTDTGSDQNDCQGASLTLNLSSN
jgi:hypothetical protein